MGIGDYLWPFERSFTEIPGAREAGIACLLGGPGLGAVSIIVTGTPKHAYKISVYSGFAIFWITMIYARTKYSIAKANESGFIKAYKAGKFD